MKNLKETMNKIKGTRRSTIFVIFGTVALFFAFASLYDYESNKLIVFFSNVILIFCWVYAIDCRRRGN